MIRSGEVEEKDGDLLTVVFERPEACGNCNGCLSKQCTNVTLPGVAEVGDEVEVALPDKNIVGASAIAYLIPLAMLIGGLFLGYGVYEPLGISMRVDVFAALCGGVLVGVGLGVVHGIDKRLRRKQAWQPRIVAVRSGLVKPPPAMDISSEMP